jgi:hypothetical protein
MVRRETRVGVLRVDVVPHLRREGRYVSRFRPARR